MSAGPLDCVRELAAIGYGQSDEMVSLKPSGSVIVK